MTAPDPDGDGAARAMTRRAARTPGSRRRDVDYINAHGTSTPVQRQGRDPGDQAGVRRRTPAGSPCQLDQVDDRPPARRRGRHRGDRHRAGDPRTASCRRRSTTRRPTRSATSTTCRTQARKPDVDVALSNALRLRRHQRDPRLPALARLTPRARGSDRLPRGHRLHPRLTRRRAAPPRGRGRSRPRRWPRSRRGSASRRSPSSCSRP